MFYKNMTFAYRTAAFLTENLEGKRPLGRHRCRWEERILEEQGRKL
jgi:hypothetical protein